MTEIYVSTDVETDGPLAGRNSMLSFGSAAFTADGELVDTFTRNLVPTGEPDPETMKWWSTQPDAWLAATRDQVPPTEAMLEYVAWLYALPGKPVFVGYPATFDFSFVYSYLIRYAGESPFSFSALDIKSFAMAVLGTEYRKTTKRNMPRRWFGDEKHSHIALEDAIEQGRMFIRILQESRGRRPK